MSAAIRPVVVERVSADRLERRRWALALVAPLNPLSTAARLTCGVDRRDTTRHKWRDRTFGARESVPADVRAELMAGLHAAIDAATEGLW
jgi:hypothetical protein